MNYFYQQIYLPSVYWDLEDAPNAQTAQKVVDKQTDKPNTLPLLRMHAHGVTADSLL